MEPACNSLYPSPSALFPILSLSLSQKEGLYEGTWLTRLEEHAILDLGVVSLNPTLGVEIT